MAGAPAIATAKEGDWLIRGRIITVNPNDSSGTLSGVPTAGVALNNDQTLELDFTYMLSNNLGLELIAGTTKHHVTGTGSLAGADVGKVKVLPPTLTLQYHFSPGAKISPYAGVGINYTKFYNSKPGTALAAGSGVKYKDSWGLAAQVGMDIRLNNKWFLNLDAKYIKIDTTATVTGTSSSLGSVNVDVNPWVLGVGIGTRF
jgi:outer membrane protein